MGSWRRLPKRLGAVTVGYWSVTGYCQLLGYCPFKGFEGWCVGGSGGRGGAAPPPPQAVLRF